MLPIPDPPTQEIFQRRILGALPTGKWDLCLVKYNWGGGKNTAFHNKPYFFLKKQNSLTKTDCKMFL